jgi:hypothetical protein
MTGSFCQLPLGTEDVGEAGHLGALLDQLLLIIPGVVVS